MSEEERRRRKEAEAEWLRAASLEDDKWEAPPSPYDPEDPGLLSDEIGRNYAE
jgi:hypothetical protein